LNPDKPEAIIIGTGARQRSEGSLEVIELVHIQPLESIHGLGVVIDAHVNSVCKAVNYHAKALYVTSGKG